MSSSEHIHSLIMQLAEPHASPQQTAIEHQICDIVESGSTNLLPYHKLFAMVLFKRLEKQINLLELNDWRLFNCLFRHYSFANLWLELRCTEIRKALLLATANAPASTAGLQALMLSIASQCHKNEYAYFVEETEKPALELLRSRLTTLLGAGENSQETAVLLVCQLMYSAPGELAHIDRLLEQASGSLPADLAAFIGTTLAARRREHEQAQQYLDEQRIVDGVSRKVSDMYKDNPYPRWTEALVGFNPDRQPLNTFSGVASFSRYNDAAPEVNSILVAGCGTGRHPIQLALNYPWLRILAIDISHRSLGYAAMMAEKAGITNIEFKVCDILQLAECDEQFDMIDSIGVLHHMRDPEQGLQALLTCLQPHGLIRLGLYSRSARRSIIEFRNRESHDRDRLDQDALRQIRRRVILEHKDWHKEILQFDDFYSLSGCRDLLLHTQEVQYTIPEIKSLLDRQGLNFLGLGLPHAKLATAIKQTCGADADIQDPDNWHAAEQADPLLFAKMYNFFAQKRH